MFLVEADERGQVAARRGARDREPRGVETPRRGVGLQVVDRLEAVLELRREDGRGGEPISDRGDGVAFVDEPGDGAVVLGSVPPGGAVDPDDDGERPRGLSGGEEQVETLPRVPLLDVRNVADSPHARTVREGFRGGPPDGIHHTRLGRDRFRLRCGSEPPPAIGRPPGPPRGTAAHRPLELRRRGGRSRHVTRPGQIQPGEVAGAIVRPCGQGGPDPGEHDDDGERLEAHGKLWRANPPNSTPRNRRAQGNRPTMEGRPRSRGRPMKETMKGYRPAPGRRPAGPINGGPASVRSGSVR